MKHKETCSCCGHSVTAYTLPINHGLVNAFVKFAELYIAGGRVPIKKGHIGLTNSQYSNFQNLRHFYLISQDSKGCAWSLTKFGEDFFYGQKAVMSPAAHIGGKTLANDHPAWSTHEEIRKRVYIFDVMPEMSKQRDEYQAEKGFRGPSLFDAEILATPAKSHVENGVTIHDEVKLLAVSCPSDAYSTL